MPINFVHAHLLLNHVPTVGAVVAVGFLALALARHSDELVRASMASFFAIALVSLITYMTGYSAEAALKLRPGVSTDLIGHHQSAALVALAAMEVTGVLAWFALWRYRTPKGPAVWAPRAVLVLALVTLVLMAGVANVGGEISHPEILSPGETSAAAGVFAPAVLRSNAIQRYEFRHANAWPTLEALHFIGLCLIFGVVMLGNLRLLGLMSTAALLDIHALLPWGVIGFIVNAITGMAFFVGQSFQYIDNVAFQWKVALMLLAGLNFLYLTYFDDVWASAPGQPITGIVRAFALSQILLWIGVIYFGRMLPYIGNAF